MNTEMSQPGRLVKSLYITALVIALLSQIFFVGSSWVALAVGGGLPLLFIPLLGWRLVHVWRNPAALQSPPGHSLSAFVRGIGLFVMLVGILGVVAQIFVGPLTRLLLGRPDGGESGIGYFVVGVGLYFLSAALVPGILLFELGRWTARTGERLGDETSAKAAAIVIASAVTFVVVGMFVFLTRSNEPLRSRARPVQIDRTPGPPTETVEVVAGRSDAVRTSPLSPPTQDAATPLRSLPMQRFDRDGPSTIVVSPGSLTLEPPSAMPPAPQPPRPDYRGAAGLKMSSPYDLRDRVIEGLTVSYCCAGAFSAAQATRGAPAGRSYLETMFVAEPGRKEKGTWSSLSVGAYAIQPNPFSPLRGLKSGDVVGITIDTDALLAQYEINGQPIGIQRLQVVDGRELRLWLAVGAPRGGSKVSDRWIVNFGAEPFVFPRTEPILTYEGRLQAP